MPSTLKQAIGEIERLCDYPLYSSVSDGRVAELLVREVDFINNELNLTEKPWYYQTIDIQVQANDEWVALSGIGDLGTVSIVETSEPGNPKQARRPVSIVSPLELDRYYAGNQPSSVTPKASALGCCFAEMPGSPGTNGVKFGPKPGATATYTLYYTPDVRRPQSLQDSPLRFPQYELYCFHRAACKVITYAEWEGMTDQQNDTKRNRISGDAGNPKPGTLCYGVAEYGKQFDVMKYRQGGQRATTRLVGYGRYTRGR